MEDMITGLIERAGLSREQAERVVDFLRENATKVPGWIGGTNIGQQMADKLPGGLGGLFGKK